LQLTCVEQGDPAAGIAVGQTGSMHCHCELAQLQVASPYAQLACTPALPVYAMQRLPWAGRAAGQVQRRASEAVPQTQV